MLKVSQHGANSIYAFQLMQFQILHQLALQGWTDLSAAFMS